jgi:hypothetical protein
MLPALAGAPAALTAMPALAGAAPDALAGVVLVAGVDLVVALAAGAVVIDDDAGVASPLGAAAVLGVAPSPPPQPMAATTHNPAQPKRSLL